MIQQPDWKAQREAIRKRLEVYTPAGIAFASDTERLLVADLRILLAKSEEDERELKQCRDHHQLWIQTFGSSQLTHAKARLEAAESSVEKLTRHLALREQRISELELLVYVPKICEDDDVITYADQCARLLRELSALRKANEEVWEKAAKIADKYALANKAHAVIPMEIAARLRDEAARQSREDEGK